MRVSLFRVIHRLTGLSVILPMVLFVVSGVPLQFTGALQLGSQGVPFKWVHGAYGIDAPAEALTAAGIVQLDDTLLFENRAVNASGRMLGAFLLEDFVLVTTESELLVVPQDGAVPIERVRLPATAQAVGITPPAEVFISSRGEILRSPDLGASWSAAAAADVAWLHTEPRPATGEEAGRYGAIKISWERWLQDLHSGRFFGTVGVWVMSLAALAFVALGVTGLVIWFNTRRSRTKT